MANEKPISKDYLLTQLKNYETEIINKKYIEKEDGKGLSSNDYTTEEKNKLAGLENYNDTALSNRVKTVEDEVPNLATKTYVGEQIANAEHLKREIVTVLPSDTEASDNIIYMLKVESATGNDKYQEYMKIDGTVQMVGDTSVDLTDYAKSAEIPTTVSELTDSAAYAKTTDIPTTLPANGGNADTVNNHTVKSDVPENAVFTDTVYDDTDIKAEIAKKADATSTPHIDETTKNWFIGDVDTGILAEGTNGTDGTTYTPSIGEVTTVDSNELASASVSVNTETKEAVFNFAIPKGNKGLDGKDGVQISDVVSEDSTWSSKKINDSLVDKADADKVVPKITITDTTTADAKTVIEKNWSTIPAETSAATIVTSNYGYNALINKQGKYGTVMLTVPVSGESVYYGVLGGSSWTWKELATMDKVADVPNTVIVSEDIIVKLNSNCYYTVINGVCYVTLWGFTCTGAGQYVVNSSMPKTKLTMKGVCTYGSSGYVGGCAYILYDGNGNNKLYVEVKSTNEPLYGSFSYPVAES